MNEFEHGPHVRGAQSHGREAPNYGNPRGLWLVQHEARGIRLERLAQLSIVSGKGFARRGRQGLAACEVDFRGREISESSIELREGPT